MRWGEILISLLSLASDEIERCHRALSRSRCLNGISHRASFPFVRLQPSSKHRPRSDPLGESKSMRMVTPALRVNFTRHYPDADFFVLSGWSYDVKAVGRPFQYGRRTCCSTAGISCGTCAKTGDTMRYIATRVTDEHIPCIIGELSFNLAKERDVTGVSIYLRTIIILEILR